MEVIFKSVYSNDLVKKLFAPDKDEQDDRCASWQENQLPLLEIDCARRDAFKGGFAEAVIRIMLAVADAAGIHDQVRFKKAEEIIRSDARLRRIKPEQYENIIKEQSRILQLDEFFALTALAVMLPDAPDRKAAMDIAVSFAASGGLVRGAERSILKKIESILAACG